MQGWWQSAYKAVSLAQPFLSTGAVVALFLHGLVAFMGSVSGIFGWHAGLATKADVEDSVGHVSKRVDDSEGRVVKRVDDSEARVVKRVEDSELRMKESVEGVQKSVESLRFMVIVPAIVVAFFVGNVHTRK